MSSATLVGVSYATDPPRDEQFAALTYGTLSSTDGRATRASWSALDVATSSVVLLLIGLADSYFSS